MERRKAEIQTRTNRQTESNISGGGGGFTSSLLIGRLQSTRSFGLTVQLGCECFVMSALEEL
ncbi:hypothetical protein AAC387_Pa01g3200 [Persea americana]